MNWTFQVHHLDRGIVRAIDRSRRFSTFCLRLFAAGLTVIWLQTAAVGDTSVKNTPISPATTNSPRATLSDFISYMDKAYLRITTISERALENPGLFYSPEQRQEGKLAEDAFERAIDTLDLSEVPPATREDFAAENALLLKEILDRLPDIPDEAIPDAETAETEDIQRWLIPGTRIEIVRIDEGFKAGEYLFSYESLKRVHDYYDEIEDLPYQPGASEGFYEFYIATPGELLPPKWSHWLPSWSNHLILEQTLWQWFSLILGATLVVTVLWTTQRVLKRQFPPQHTVQSAWMGLILPTVGVTMLLLASYVLDNTINITGDVLVVLEILDAIFLFAFLTWFAFLLFNAIGATILLAPRFQKSLLEATMIRNGFRLLGIVASATVLAIGCEVLGVSVAPLLASLGAGSLAISFGLQPYVRDTIGGITLFANRSLQIGDFCEFGGVAGTVEDIGLRATLIRTPDRKLIVVPNANVSTTLVNHSRRDKFVFDRDLTIADNGTRERLSTLLRELREFLDEFPLTADTSVTLLDLSGTSIALHLFAYILTTDKEKYHDVKANLLLGIEDKLKELDVQLVES